MNKTILIILGAVLLLAGCAGGGGSDIDNGSDSQPTAKWYVAKGAPSNADGADGDLYLDTDSSVLYIKVEGVWQSAASLKGAPGTGWLFGSGPPAASIGSNGDLYLDTVSTIAYRKFNDAWESMFALQGAAGAAGAAWFTGWGAPTASVPAGAAAGDFYLDTITTVIYKKEGSGAWSSVVMFQTAAAPQYVFTPGINNYEEFLDVGFGNGIFIAVGSISNGQSLPIGFVARTTDGTNWASSTMPTPPIQNSLINGGDPIMKGLTQPSAIELEAGSPLYGVAYGNGVFVAVGDAYIDGVDNICIHTSTDGISWTPRQITSLNDSLRSVIFANNLFIATGIDNASGYPVIRTSLDGTTWDNWTPPGNWVSNVAYGNEKFIAFCQPDPVAVYKSTDGVNWAMDGTATGVNGYIGPVHQVVYGNGMFVAIGSGDRNDVVLISSDGTNWFTQDLPATGINMYGISFGSGFIITGKDWNGNGIILTSPNGISWSVQQWPGSGPFYGSAWGSLNGGTYVISRSQPPS
jgi:hypothetical protein